MMPSAIAARTQLNPMNAGGMLLGVLFVCVLAGALIGWAVGSTGIGIAIGSVIGIPAAIFAVYRTYRSAF
jgi:F0F1-type ATP synthase assembly protein I